MKQKILFIVNHDIVIYNFRKELVERLIKENYDVYICSPYGKRIEYLIEMGCHFIEQKVNRHGTNPLSDLFLILNYKKIIKKINPKVVLTYTIKPNIYGGIASALCNIPFIANITGLGTAVENIGLMQKITICLYKLAFKKVKMVFFQNEDNLKFFIKNKIPMNNYDLLPGSGVNLDFFIPIEYPDDTTIEFVYISRIMKEKGIDNYLEAARYIRNKYPFTKFHICGFCEEKYESILDNYEKEGIIKYHGLISDVRDILKVTHCTIHPTYYPEGMSNVLLESCACARPIITTNRSGCREIVDNGINGYMIPQQNTKKLIEAIERFLELKYADKKNMGLNGRKKVEKNFDRKKVIEAYMKEIGD